MSPSGLRASLLLALALAACAKPVPADKAAYVGEWRAEAMYLSITPDGSVSYKRLKDGVTTSVNGPLQEFVGDSFVVGIGPVKTTFVVTRPPAREAGAWKMVVDGVELTKTGSRGADPDPDSRRT